MHGRKYDYSKVVYTNAHEKVIIICPNHGPFKQEANSHIRGAGCQECVGLKRLTTQDFITRARKVHGKKYDYSKVVVVNIMTPVTIICPIHREFKQIPNGHLHGRECNTCRPAKLSIRNRSASKNFYPYEEWKEKVRLIGAKTHAEYRAIAESDVRLPLRPDAFYGEWDGWQKSLGVCGMNGMIPLFGNNVCDSKEEAAVQSMMRCNKINFLHHIKFGKYEPDWFLPDYGVFVEYFGYFGGHGYDRKVRAKLAYYKRNGVKCVAIYTRDLYPTRLLQIFKPYLGYMRTLLERTAA